MLRRIKTISSEIDSYRIVEEVERYRNFWKPEKARVILLAESHVRTSDEDFNHTWSYGSGLAYGNFVRFVYCLGNGEKSLVRIPSNRGTWQFWLLLSSCLNNPSDESAFYSVLRKATPNFRERMSNKIHLLEGLKRSGIWLLDASIVGVNEHKGPIRRKIVRHCWKTWTLQVLENLDPEPEHVIVIGRGVEKALDREIPGLDIEFRVVQQPQARIPGGYSKYHHECFETCARFRD